MIFNWILVDKLAIGTPLINQKDQIFLKEKNIVSILDLRNELDISKINYKKQLLLYKVFNTVNFGLPDRNSKRFATKAEIESGVNILKTLLCKGSVFMHCNAAVERSPLISVAFLLKEKNLNLTQAYEYVKQQNKTTSLLLDQLKEI